MKKNKEKEVLEGENLHKYLITKINIIDFNKIENIKLHNYDSDEVDFDKNKNSIIELQEKLKIMKTYKFYGYCLLSKIILNFLKSIVMLNQQKRNGVKKITAEEALKTNFSMSRQSGDRYKFLGKLVTKYPKLMYLNINVTDFFKKRKELEELFDEKNNIFKIAQDYWRDTLEIMKGKELLLEAGYTEKEITNIYSNANINDNKMDVK